MKVIEAYQCEKCAHAYMDKGIAEKCCICQQCGQPIDKRSYCRPCWEVNHAASMAKKLSDAQDVSESYNGPVFVGDAYFWDLDAASEYAVEEFDEGEQPEWAFCATESRFSLDVDRILEDAEGNHSFGLEDYEPLRIGYDELREAVEKYVAANEGDVVYHCDHSRKVRLSREATQSFPAEMELP